MKLPAIAIASDHAGYQLKEEIKKVLNSLGIEYVDFGANGTESTDYPDFAAEVAREVQKGKRGILCCGTGIGMSIAANKFRGIRAAVCNDPQVAKMSREHNDANILTMGGRVLKDPQMIQQIVRTWLDTPFEGGRHQRRIDKIKQFEQE